MLRSTIQAVLIGLLAAPPAAGCAADGGAAGGDLPTPTAPVTSPAVSCPGRAHGDRPVMIDYVDFVVFGGREYLATRATLPAGQLGQHLGAVKCRLDGSDASPSYQPRDGDAAFLPAGTPLFAVRGRPVGAVVAARVDGRLRLYSADHADG